MQTVSAKLGLANLPFEAALSGVGMPAVFLGRLLRGVPERICATDLIRGARDVVLGVPGAFTPICTTIHLPAFVSNIKALKAAGYGSFYCITPNDPWTTARWAAEVDPTGEVTFLADGNLAFVSALGLTTDASAHFLGTTSKRYLMTLHSGTIDKAKVEADIMDVKHTNIETLLI